MDIDRIPAATATSAFVVGSSSLPPPVANKQKIFGPLEAATAAAVDKEVMAADTARLVFMAAEKCEIEEKKRKIGFESLGF